MQKRLVSPGLHTYQVRKVIHTNLDSYVECTWRYRLLPDTLYLYIYVHVLSVHTSLYLVASYFELCRAQAVLVRQSNGMMDPLKCCLWLCVVCCVRATAAQPRTGADRPTEKYQLLNSSVPNNSMNMMGGSRSSHGEIPTINI